MHDGGALRSREETLLRCLQNATILGRVLVGFDGFVDAIVRPIQHANVGNNGYFASIGDFGQYLTTKSGKSCSIELDTLSERAGGNMVLYAHALGRLGVNTDCVGALGYPEVLPLFREYCPESKVYSVANPGHCSALEFSDGKVMLFQGGTIQNLDFPLLRQRLGVEKLASLLVSAQAVSFMNWGELQGATSIWRGVLEMLPALHIERKLFVTDISDCSRRSKRDILEFLELLVQYNQHFRVVLSLNLNEAEILGEVFGCPAAEPVPLAQALFARLGIDTLVIHLLDGSVGCGCDGAVRVAGHQVMEPLISTGGGDHFNAGLCYGLMLELSLADALALGNLVSECYVTTGESPGRRALVEKIDLRMHGQK